MQNTMEMLDLLERQLDTSLVLDKMVLFHMKVPRMMVLFDRSEWFHTLEPHKKELFGTKESFHRTEQHNLE